MALYSTLICKELIIYALFSFLRHTEYTFNVGYYTF